MKSILKTLLIAAALVVPLAANAQQFPSKSVTLVIPFSPGASNDIFGRYLAENLTKLWKQTVLVENRPGAGGALGAANVSKAKPDGYTLLFSSSSYTTNAAVEANMPFDPQKDLKPVGIAAIGQMIVIVGPRLPLSSLADLVKHTKAQKVFYGTSGAGSSSTFTAELLNDVAGMKMETVNYKGGTEALIDLVGGRIDVYVGSVTSVLPTVNAKTAKAIAVASKLAPRRCRMCRPWQRRVSPVLKPISGGGYSPRPVRRPTFLPG